MIAKEQNAVENSKLVEVVDDIFLDAQMYSISLKTPLGTRMNSTWTSASD